MKELSNLITVFPTLQLLSNTPLIDLRESLVGNTTFAMDSGTKDLCQHCAKLIPPSKSLPRTNHDHHANLALLELSSESCALCTAILTLWSLENVQNRYPDVKKETYEEILVEMRVLETYGSDDSLAWELLSVGFEIQPQIPKRLIDVGRASVFPKLVTCTELANESLRYATLSYCWGLTTFKTTKATVYTYSRALPYDDLPKTYRDAITLARSLEINYLWIDALCIVQDDNAEWQQEASRMQDIYAGSDLTIAATDAPDGSTGCFPPCTVELLSDGTSNTVVFATKDSNSNQERIVQFHVGDSRQVASHSILNTRGWTLQEMVLSHRILHCMRSSLFWQCKTHFKTETGLTFDYSTPAMRHNLFNALDPTSKDMHRNWWTWMESYSRREFSFPSDRLPAMAGLVHHYQAASRDEPMLGLWERSFTQDLLWMRQGPLSKTSAITHVSNIPSWSWLACPAILKFDNWGLSEDKSEKEKLQITTDHSSLVDWSIKWSSEPLVSDVKSSRVIIEGPVLALTFNTSPESLKFSPPYLNVNDEKLDFEKQGVPWRCSAQFDLFEAKDRIFPASYLCLLLRSSVYKSGNYTEETFMILKPVVDLKNTYRRTGIGGIRGDKRTFDLGVRQKLVIIYAGSDLTIAATDAPDGSIGYKFEDKSRELWEGRFQSLAMAMSITSFNLAGHQPRFEAKGKCQALAKIRVQSEGRDFELLNFW
ncbi:heterokaryon incompatibility protein-domain-containing protein [Leptodontidium sp. 2 PMI_412]|nr:heterokaryon incompatibility protein-domain-containing protein [Leptodontidium sp. 2 PMI_412]